MMFRVSLALVLLTPTSPAVAQITSATISGIVKDQTGGVLPGVDVVIKNLDTGSQIARLAVAHGHKVVISNSREPESLATLVAELGPNARAATAIEAAKAGDIVVVTLPLKNYRQVPVEPLAGKIVIDTNNYDPQRDGHH